MPNILDYDEQVVADGTEQVYCVSDPGGTPGNRKATIGNLLTTAALRTKINALAEELGAAEGWDFSNIAFDVDENGAILASVVPRTGTLNTLLAVDDASPGEIAYATDAKVQVAYSATGARLLQPITVGAYYQNPSPLQLITSALDAGESEVIGPFQSASGTLYGATDFIDANGYFQLPTSLRAADILGGDPRRTYFIYAGIDQVSYSGNAEVETDTVTLRIVAEDSGLTSATAIVGTLTLIDQGGFGVSNSITTTTLQAMAKQSYSGERFGLETAAGDSNAGDVLFGDGLFGVTFSIMPAEEIPKPT